MEKKRIRDFGIVPGRVKTGKRNAITDVPGVLVGHCTVNTEENHTGVTVIIPGPDNAFANHYTAAAYVHNGFGKSAGLVQVEELGTLETPIALTNTLNVGKVWDALAGIVIEQCQNDGLEPMSINPVVGECNDCRINQIQKRAVGEKEVRQAFEAAAEEFEEGDVGAGAGTICYGMKGGIGSASRVICIGEKEYTMLWKQNRNRNFYKELIQKAGAETELVYMKASKELLQKRLYKRNQVLNANSPFVITDEILEHHYHAFQEPWGEGEKVILQKGDIMQYSKEESKAIWNQNAEFWDCAMGDESNDFHREVVRPKVTGLLNPDPTDYILDIACGNGNYSAYLAEKAVSVLAFDYSEKMVELAKKRQKRYADHIEFCVADATNETSLMALKRNKPFTKAVSNMAVMDITDIKPLFTSVYKLLEDNGVFVFATQHPCFVTLTEKYMTPHSYYDIAIEGQPQKQCYYHRSLQDIFNLCFDTGFVIDGFYEECYFNKEIPDIIIVRAIKIER